jgi:hypothetical protein
MTEKQVRESIANRLSYLIGMTVMYGAEVVRKEIPDQVDRIMTEVENMK